MALSTSTFSSMFSAAVACCPEITAMRTGFCVEGAMFQNW